ncbi:MAG: DUF523 and DUF1722 domain-containing protein [Spirochaetia bacterium]
MPEKIEPLVFISKCLGFASCRYNGITINSDPVSGLRQFAKVITSCPEVEIGLGVPRDPIRIVNENGERILYQPATQKKITREMETYTEEYIASLPEIDGIILKSRSPSCGFKDVKIYNSLENPSQPGKGPGFFGGRMSEVFPGHPLEDEGRLNNFTIREHFFTSLWALAWFRKVKKENNFQALLEYHTKNKLLFMGYSQSKLRVLGNIVATHKKRDFYELISEYESVLRSLFEEPPNFSSIVNVLHHAFGGVSDNLNSDEKQFFLNTAEEYRDERVPLSTVLHLLQSWAIRFEDDWLKDQSFLHPYPKELMSITDSGKGRNY